MIEIGQLRRETLPGLATPSSSAVSMRSKGSEGKEFRLVQHVEARHIVDLAPAEVVQDTEVPGEEISYALVDVKPTDARDIAKLIYRTYGDTYSKEELYYPDTIEQALRNDEKFGVLARTEHGAAVGYFAVLRSDDSDVGELGEAVVNVNHRRRGLMTRMLEALIQRAEEEGLLGVFGEAVTAHEISQRANARFDFVSSALSLAYQPTERFTGLIDDYPQPISNLIDFKPLVPYDTVTPHLPGPIRTPFGRCTTNWGRRWWRRRPRPRTSRCPRRQRSTRGWSMASNTLFSWWKSREWTL